MFNLMHSFTRAHPLFAKLTAINIIQIQIRSAGVSVAVAPLLERGSHGVAEQGGVQEQGGQQPAPAALTGGDRPLRSSLLPAPVKPPPRRVR